MLYAVLIFILPPKFKNIWYGVNTRVTEKNKIIWTAGQRLFSYAIFGMGIILTICSFLQIVDKPDFVLLLIVLWGLSKFIVHKILEKTNLTTL